MHKLHKVPSSKSPALSPNKITPVVSTSYRYVATIGANALPRLPTLLKYPRYRPAMSEANREKDWDEG